MIDLSTTYLGLPLKSPLVASASPMCDSVDNLRRLEDAGVGAAVLPSLFEEQLELESRTVDLDYSRGAESFAESLNYMPNLAAYNTGPEGYLDLIRRAHERCNFPIIASLNGATSGGWVHYAKLMEEAGASAIELNIYSIPVDPRRSSADLEREYVDLVRRVKQSVEIPVAVKLQPMVTSLPHFAAELDRAGAGALVLFNRFYQPDFDIDALEIVPILTLSLPQELLLRLHWVAILFRQVHADLAITGGVQSHYDVLKCVMAGANVAMMASALLRNGTGYARRVLADLQSWMGEHEYDSIEQMRGSLARQNVPNPRAYERGNYMRVLSSYALRGARE
jgi:dihydroorotate dehydrogenase (fumarate)